MSKGLHRRNGRKPSPRSAPVCVMARSTRSVDHAWRRKPASNAVAAIQLPASPHAEHRPAHGPDGGDDRGSRLRAERPRQAAGGSGLTLPGHSTSCRSQAGEPDRVHPAAVLHEDARSWRRESEKPLLRMPHAFGAAELHERRRPAARAEATEAGGGEPLDQPLRSARVPRGAASGRRDPLVRTPEQLLR